MNSFPKCRSIIDVICNDGIHLSARVYGKQNKPRIIISHGNGLASDGYRVYWEGLIDEFEVIILDLRGHGQSELSSFDAHSYEQMIDDFEAVYISVRDKLGPSITIGAFHSLSSLVALGHMRKYGKRIDGLILFDPPLSIPDCDSLEALHQKDMATLANRVKMRRQFFDNQNQLSDQFNNTSSFSKWDSVACIDMAYAVLKLSKYPTGVWELSCPPLHESKIYSTNTSYEYWDALKNPSIPIKLVCGDPYILNAQSAALICKRACEVLGVDYEYIPNSTHFLQLEFASECRRITKKFIGKIFN